MKKKYLGIILSIMAVLGLTACGDNTAEINSSFENTSETTSESTFVEKDSSLFSSEDSSEEDDSTSEKEQDDSTSKEDDSSTSAEPEHEHELTHVDATIATCTQAGNIEYWYCAGCGKYFLDEAATIEIFLEDTSILATGHNLEHTEYKSASCTEDGNQEYWHCTECNKYFSDEDATEEIDFGDTVIQATGHTLTYVETQAATCTEAGNIEYWHCTDCGKYYVDETANVEITLEDIVIPAKGHKLIYVEAQAATCSEEGNIAYWCCEFCDICYSDSEGTNKITKESTAISTIEHTYGEDNICTSCGIHSPTSGLRYTYDNETSSYSVSVGDVTDSLIYIADAYDDGANGKHLVKALGDRAFAACSTLESAVIPNSVISLGSYAFSSCSLLTSVTLGSNVTTIGEYAFYKCTSLTSITLPNSMTTISNIAFRECTSLVNITIPDSVITIGTYVFYKCTSLESISIGQNVTSIGASAFYGCTKLASVNIPNGITTISRYLFCDCSSLTNIDLPDSVITIDSYAFRNCSLLTSLTIPNSVTSLGSESFRNCTSLTSIIITDNVTTIGASAFRGCTSMTSATIGSGLKTLNRYAFRDCTSLTNVVFKITDGWHVSTSSSATSGDTVNLTDESANATYLTDTYVNYYWFRQLDADEQFKLHI